jgi:hypothetical protein
MKRVVVMIGVAAAMLIPTIGAAQAAPLGHGNATVLNGTFPSNEEFLVNGVPTYYTFTCNEHRVQFSDGSGTDTAHCQLYSTETPPSSAAHEDPAYGWFSDFWINGAPGFAGTVFTTDWRGVVTPSGNVNIVANYLPTA